nr:DHA2 family efflux MFS transporter permease subunit [Gorillibacterium massiliense]
MENTVGKTGLSPDLSGVKRGPIVASLIIGAFVSILNETLLNIAFPDIMKEFGIAENSVQWLATVYMLVIGVLVPVTALLQQWFSTRQMFLTAMSFFLVGTVVCGLAPSFAVLLVGRIIQALGTGLLIPVLMNTILIIFPPEKRGAAMGMIGLVIMTGPAIGPTLSGLIVDSLDWRWLFYLVVPLALFSVIFAAIYLRNVSHLTKPRVDVLSIILSTIGFGGIVYGFSNTAKYNWSSPEVYSFLIVGGIALVLFVWRQLVMKEPLLELRVFKYPMFSLTAVLLLIMMMSLFSMNILVPLYLQNAIMLSAFSAGLILLPGGVLNGLMSPITGLLFDKFGPRVLVPTGLVIVCIAIYLFSGLDANTSSGTIIAMHIIMVIGIAMVMMPAQTTGLNQLPSHLYPHGTAVLNTLQQVSGAIGTALFVSIMSSSAKSYLAQSANPMAPEEAVNGLVQGVQTSFTVALVFGFAALVCGFFLKRTKAPEGNPQISMH